MGIFRNLVLIAPSGAHPSMHYVTFDCPDPSFGSYMHCRSSEYRVQYVGGRGARVVLRPSDPLTRAANARIHDAAGCSPLHPKAYPCQLWFLPPGHSV